MRDPEVACLLLQAEVTTVIPDKFLWRETLTSLDLSAESVVTRIEYSFLAQCTSLTSIDLSGLIHVTKISSCFLYRCTALRTLDLTPFSNVTQLGDCFLEGCSSLCTLDLSSLSSVTDIDPFGFLAGCTSLESIYLTGCSDVVSSRARKGTRGKLVVESRPNLAETNHLRNPASD